MHVKCTYSIYSFLALGNVIVNDKSSIILHIGFGNIENSALRLLQQRHHDLCHNIALEYFTIINRARHHYPCTIKLKSVRITGKLWLWHQTFLKYHFQCVHIGNSTSEYCDILSVYPRQYLGSFAVCYIH